MTIVREVLTPFNAHLDLNTLVVLQIPLHTTLVRVGKMLSLEIDWPTSGVEVCKGSANCILMWCTLYSAHMENEHVFFWFRLSIFIIVCASFFLQEMFLCGFLVIFRHDGLKGEHFLLIVHSSWGKGPFVILYLQKFNGRKNCKLWGRCFCNPLFTQIFPKCFLAILHWKR